MKKANSIFLTLVPLLSLFVLMSACNSSRNAGGFQYRSQVVAPDAAMGSTNKPEKSEITAGNPAEVSAASRDAALLNSPVEIPEISLDKEKAGKFVEVQNAFRNALKENAQSATPVTNRELMHKTVKQLEDEGKIDHLSRKEEKKLDRIARKMDRKMQASDFDILDNTNTEWFFLILAAAGLVVGIFGVWFGWIVFLVFGGLYLYFKLLK